MSFLKTLGLAIVKGLLAAEKVANPIEAILTVAGSILEANIPSSAKVVTVVQSDVARFFKIIQDAEAMGAAINTPGPDKLKMAAPLVGQQVLDIINQLGFKVADPNKFAGAVTGLTSVTADLYNALAPK